MQNSPPRAAQSQSSQEILAASTPGNPSRLVTMTGTGSRARQEANDRAWHLRGKCRNVKSAALALQPFCAKTCAMVLGSPAGARGGIFGSGTRGTVSGHSRLLYRFCVSNFISKKTFLKSPATEATKNKKWIQRTLPRCTPKEAWQGDRKNPATPKPRVPRLTDTRGPRPPSG